MNTLEKILESKPLSPTEAIKKLNPDYVDELHLKNLERDERIVFRVVQKPIIAKDTSGQVKEIYKASQRVPNKCTIYDGISTHEIEYPGEISFYRDTASEIVISGKEPQKFPLLWFLRMSNNNLSNPNAILGSEFIYEEVAELTLSQGALDKEVEISELISFINAKSLEDTAQLCKQLNVACGQTEIEKKMALIGYMKSDINRQKFKSVSINKMGSYKELIDTAMQLDILALDNETKMWSRKSNGEKSYSIIQVPIGEDSKEFLIKYFIGDARGKKLKTYFEEKTKSILAGRKADQVGKSI